MSQKHATARGSNHDPGLDRTGSIGSDGERALVERAQSGDRDAFEQLVFRYDRQILRLAFTMLGDREQARDVYQETFMKAYRSIARFRFDSSFYTWIYRIAKNVSIDHRRRRNRLSRESPLEADPETDPDALAPIDFLPSNSPDGDPERSLFGVEIRHAIATALEKLTGKERLVFELRHYHGLRLRAVGEEAGISEEMAKNYLFRGTKKMRSALAHLRITSATSG